MSRLWPYFAGVQALTTTCISFGRRIADTVPGPASKSTAGLREDHRWREHARSQDLQRAPEVAPDSAALTVEGRQLGPSARFVCSREAARSTTGVQATVDELSAGNVRHSSGRTPSVNYKDALAALARAVLRRLPLIAGIDVSGIVESSSDPGFTTGSRCSSPDSTSASPATRLRRVRAGAGRLGRDDS